MVLIIHNSDKIHYKLLLLFTVFVAFDAVALLATYLGKKSGNHLTCRYLIRESARHSPPSARVHCLPLNTRQSFFLSSSFSPRRLGNRTIAEKEDPKAD